MVIHERRGFTIVELLVVIVVIGILAAIVILSYNGLTGRAKVSVITNSLSQTAKKLETHKTQNSETYPSSLSNAGINDSTLTYVYYASTNIYCVGKTDGSLSYYISSLQPTPKEGACQGQTVNGSACPANYVTVPGDSRFGTTTFCIMKYEARNVSGTATSQATSGPWESISQASAITAANNACSGCHLVSEAEWLTTAHNILSVHRNWSGNAVGSGFVYSGNNDGTPGSAQAASTDDSNGYINTSNSSPSNQKRTLILSNGETIWDMAGNTQEWTTGTVAAGQSPGLVGESSYAWKEWNNGSLQLRGVAALTLPSFGTAAASNWTSAQGIGSLYSNYGYASTGVFARGGHSGQGVNAGILNLLIGATTDAGVGVGFRVARSL